MTSSRNTRIPFATANKSTMMRSSNARAPFQNISNAGASRNSTKIATTKKFVLPRSSARSKAQHSARHHVTTKLPAPRFTNSVRNKDTKPFLLKTVVKATAPRTQPIAKIDPIGGDDPLNVTHYVDDMYKTFRKQEVQASVYPSYMINQPDWDKKMRARLIDWLLGVHFFHQHLTTDTLYLAISILDRFLAARAVRKDQLKLFGVTCLLLASKYEDIYPIPTDDLVCKKGRFNRDDIFATEVIILRALNYRISFPTANTFLRLFLKTANADEQTTNIARYMLDTTLVNYNLLLFRPSHLAAAAIYIARDHVTPGSNAWTLTLANYTGYDLAEISMAANAMLQGRESSLQGQPIVHHKFNESCNGCVAGLDFKSTV